MGVFGPRNPLFQEMGIRAPVWVGGIPTQVWQKSCSHVWRVCCERVLCVWVDCTNTGAPPDPKWLETWQKQILRQSKVLVFFRVFTCSFCQLDFGKEFPRFDAKSLGENRLISAIQLKIV